MRLWNELAKTAEDSCQSNSFFFPQHATYSLPLIINSELNNKTADDQFKYGVIISFIVHFCYNQTLSIRVPRGFMQFALSMLYRSCSLASFHLSDDMVCLIFQPLSAVGVSTSLIFTSIFACATLRSLSSSLRPVSVQEGQKCLLSQLNSCLSIGPSDQYL